MEYKIPKLNTYSEFLAWCEENGLKLLCRTCGKEEVTRDNDECYDCYLDKLENRGAIADPNPITLLDFH